MNYKITFSTYINQLGELRAQIATAERELDLMPDDDQYAIERKLGYIEGLTAALTELEKI